jgi:hypothetical protein
MRRCLFAFARLHAVQSGFWILRTTDTAGYGAAWLLRSFGRAHNKK